MTVVLPEKSDEELLDCLSLAVSLLDFRRDVLPLLPIVLFNVSPNFEARAEAERTVLRLL